jgi:hypothetical protein
VFFARKHFFCNSCSLDFLLNWSRSD